jgi:hypothetical protein
MGGVTINIPRATNMTATQLQKAVTDGLNSAYSQLIARRGTSQSYGA